MVVSLGQICSNALATLVWGQILSKDNSQIFYLPTRSFCYFILLLLHISKKSKRSVKSNLYFSVIETNNFLKELRDGFFFLLIAIFGYMTIEGYIYIYRGLVKALLVIYWEWKIKKKCTWWRYWDAEGGKELSKEREKL